MTPTKIPTVLFMWFSATNIYLQSDRSRVIIKSFTNHPGLAALQPTSPRAAAQRPADAWPLGQRLAQPTGPGHAGPGHVARCRCDPFNWVCWRFVYLAVLGLFSRWCLDVPLWNHHFEMTLYFFQGSKKANPSHEKKKKKETCKKKSVLVVSADWCCFCCVYSNCLLLLLQMQK